MAYIDADGLFDGDRFDLMSDEARLFWPHFWCATNTVGRIELNYRKVIGTAFKRWKKPPSEAQFGRIVLEYRDAYLLFIYEANGSVWGQWDASEKFLPRHKLAADTRTPAPDAEVFSAWKSAYISHKNAKSTAFNVFGKLAKSCESLRGNVHGEGIGSGIGIGIGSGENHSSPAGAGDALAPSKPALTVVAPVDEWFDEFWQSYWRKVGKDAARIKFRARVKTRADWELVKRALEAQRPEYMARDPDLRPHPATWLGQGRMFDEKAPPPTEPPRAKLTFDEKRFERLVNREV